MNKINKIIWLIFAVVSATLITIYALSDFLLTPEKVIPDLGGDGIKNTFCYLYHSIYGKGYWFQGVNYPFGEHLFFTDGMPALSCFFACMGNVDVKTALIAFNLLIGLSFIVSIIYIYLILLIFGVKPILSIIFSCLIGIFSPVIFNLQGHYSLCFGNIVPLIFYWNMQYKTNSNWKYLIYIYILGILISFFHLYLAALLFFWVAFYALGYFLFNKTSIQHKLRHTLPIFLISCLVFVTVFTIMYLTDPIKDRPKVPNGYGAEIYFTSINHIFFSEYTFLGAWLEKKKIIEFNIFNEGYTYLGIIPIIVLLVTFFIWIANIILRNKNNITYKFDAIWLFIGIGILFFSMGIPFRYNFSWIFAKNPYFKNLRSLGRFSWIFYYVMTIFAVIQLNKYCAYFIKIKKPGIAASIIILAIGVWGYEVFEYSKIIRKRMEDGRSVYKEFFSINELNWNDFLKQHQYAPTDFQSILLLPFIHSGTEKFALEDGSWIMTLGYKASIQTAIPIIDSWLSRSSWSQAKKQIKLISGPYTEKPILSENGNKKPILLLCLDDYKLDKDQKYLLESSQFLGVNAGVHAYVLYPENQLNTDKIYTDSILKIAPYMHGHDTCMGNCDNLYINHFDSSREKESLFGWGSVLQTKIHNDFVFNIPFKKSSQDSIYEFSLWFLLGDKDYNCPFVKIVSLDSNHNEIEHYYIYSRQSHDTHGMWFRASSYITLNPACASLVCSVHISEVQEFLALDELLFRSSSSIVISKSTDHKLMVNNHLFK